MFSRAASRTLSGSSPWPGLGRRWRMSCSTAMSEGPGLFHSSDPSRGQIMGRAGQAIFIQVLEGADMLGPAARVVAPRTFQVGMGTL
eukprot:2544806-Pyramimonas_sp.AAC.1